MNTKHTPGPWIAGTTVHDDSGRPIAKVNFKHQPVCWANNNARLIAAAPDLLAALQALNARIESYGAGNVPESVAARAAIAKATQS